MSSLQIVEMHISQGPLLRFLHSQRLLKARGDADFGYGIHAWLRAAFRELAPQPWRLFADQRRPPRILAYSQYSADALRTRLTEHGEPLVQAVCPPENIYSKAMPVWNSGRRLGFSLKICPVGRKSRQGTEKDLFLLAADKNDGAGVERDAVYCQWVGERLRASGAAVVERIVLEKFRRVRLLRKTQGRAGERELKSIERPEAVLSGTLMIADVGAFQKLLASGIGRHKAFGFGMVLLKPPSR